MKTSKAEQARRVRFHQFMTVYWSARQSWLEAKESATANYEEEERAWVVNNPPVLFKQYLIDTAGQPR